MIPIVPVAHFVNELSVGWNNITYKENVPKTIVIPIYVLSFSSLTSSAGILFFKRFN